MDLQRRVIDVMLTDQLGMENPQQDGFRFSRQTETAIFDFNTMVEKRRNATRTRIFASKTARVLHYQALVRFRTLGALFLRTRFLLEILASW